MVRRTSRCGVIQLFAALSTLGGLLIFLTALTSTPSLYKPEELESNLLDAVARRIKPDTVSATAPVRVPTESSPGLNEDLIMRSMRNGKPLCPKTDPRKLRKEYLKFVRKHHDRSGDREIEAIQRQRREAAEAACRHSKQATPILSLPAKEKEMTLRHILVDDMSRMLYCFIPKTSCTNWKTIFKTIQEKDPYPGCFKLDHTKDAQTLDKYSDDEIQARLDTYYKFTFARDPMKRLISAYGDKFKETEEEGKYGTSNFFHNFFGRHIVSRYRSNATQEALKTGSDVTWEEFVRFIVNEHKDTLYVDDHWMPAESICRPCTIQYDYLGHFEHLEKESNYILRQKELDRRVFFPPKQSWYGTQPAKKVTFKGLPPALQASLVGIYLDSYKMFDYPLPDIGIASHV